MKLHNAAKYFNTEPVYDAYTGALLFYAQLPPPDNASSGDGATYHHRALITAPEATLPTRQALRIYTDIFLAGSVTPDGFGGTPIRRRYTMKLVTHLMHLLTPGQALSVASGTQAYTQGVFYKDMPNAQTDSGLDSFWNFFVAVGEPAAKGTFLRAEDGTLYRVRNEYIPAEGLRIAQADTLDADAFTTAVFDTGSVNPVTQVKASGTQTVNAIFLETPKYYKFTHVSDPGSQPGDYSVFVPSSITVTSGQTFTAYGVKWRVLSAIAELDATAIHARRA